MPTSSIRVLVAEDFEQWRLRHCETLRKHPEFQIIGAVSDGLEAVHDARRLQPDLILLDIGLPTLNGIEAARRIREISPPPKIIFVSENRSVDIIEEALSTGAEGYVVKSDAGSELLPAVEAVLAGRRFVSSSLADYDLINPKTARSHRDNDVIFPKPQSVGIPRQHEAQFYSDDATFLDGFTEYISAALMTGKSVIVVATKSYRDNLLLRLQTPGLNIAAAIEEGRYTSLDAADTLSTFMVNGSPDPVRFQKAAGDLIMAAAKAVNGETARVVACGESAPLLWTQGNVDAAIRVEHLWDELAISHGIHILCGYSLPSFQGGVGSYAFEKICSAHSAVHSR